MAANLKAQVPSSPGVILQPEAPWVPLPPHFRKVNVDASWCVTTRQVYLGIVVRDHAGVFVVARRGPIMTLSVLAVEALVVLGGYLLAREMRFPNIMVELDSKEVISSLEGSIHSGC